VKSTDIDPGLTRGQGPWTDTERCQLDCKTDHTRADHELQSLRSTWCRVQISELRGTSPECAGTAGTGRNL